MRPWQRALFVACLALPGAAAAQDHDDPLPNWYFGPLVGYFFPDSARDAEEGVNAQFVIGGVLADAVALELNGFGTELTRESDGDKNDYVYGGALNLTLGVPAPGNPFFLVGVGAVEQDLVKVKRTDTYGELGMGFYLPYSMAGELWRLEARYHVVFNEHPEPAIVEEELLEDGRINLGVLFAFGGEAPVEPAETGPPPSPPVAALDSDRDGVADAADQCPDTPNWVRPDANGCAPDSDRDGVDDPRDQCPGTPSGVAVDATGCEPKTAPEPAALAPPSDADGDGVNDSADACPHTVPRFDVDDRGCVRPEDVILKAVHFDLDSVRLTADGFALLRSLSAALKADLTIQLEIAGHTDTTGSTGYNRKLAAERARVVYDFLTYTGVDGHRFAIKSYGESQPVADEVTPEGRAKNRRVTFKRLRP